MVDICPRESRVDHTDCLDDDYLVESAGPPRYHHALGKESGEGGYNELPPLSREKERERAAAALQAAQPLPNLTELGSRHQACLTAEDAADFTPLDEAVVRMVERGKSTEVPPSPSHGGALAPMTHPHLRHDRHHHAHHPRHHPRRHHRHQVKRRMYGTILLLGGVSHTPGLAAYLEWCAAAFQSGGGIRGGTRRER